MRVGYARVSSLGKSLEIQYQRLTEQCCEKIFEEKKAAKNDDRSQLKGMLKFVHEGDQAIITKLDRLARSTFDLQRIAKTLEDKKVDIIFLDHKIDTSMSTGRLLFTMIGAIVDFEHDPIAYRSAEGRKVAKEKGFKFGVPQKFTKNEKELLVNLSRMGESKSNLAEISSTKHTTVYHILKETKAC